MTMYHGSGFLLENHLWATLSLHRIGVLTIVEPGGVGLPGARGHHARALEVSDDRWQSVVSDLIGKADMMFPNCR